MKTAPVAVSSVVHWAAPVQAGEARQLCAGCGAVLQEGEPLGEWPAGVPVVFSSTPAGSQCVPFEGITPGRFPECSQPR